MTSESDPVDFRTPQGADYGQSEWTTGEKEWARKKVERKHKLRLDVISYVVVNLFLVGVWAATGSGYFWPGWVIAGWGVLLLLDAISVYTHRPVTTAEIERELRGRG
ncbi:2TM domain-containing protein [Nocardia terrae]|nr:2TM domain-containing protein [Nocardia terrae]